MCFELVYMACWLRWPLFVEIPYPVARTRQILLPAALLLKGLPVVFRQRHIEPNLEMSEVRETVNARAEPTRSIGITGTDYADLMPANTADDLIAPFLRLHDII